MRFCPVVLAPPTIRPGSRRARIAVFATILLAAASASGPAASRADGQLKLGIVDAETGQPIPVRVHLRNTRGRPVKLQRGGTAAYSDHFYIDGGLALPLGVGQYTIEIEGTPEYRTVSSQPFEIERHADDSKTIEAPRFVNLAKEGWWGGDLDASRLPADLPLAMRAEGLNFLADRLPTARSASAARGSRDTRDKANRTIANGDHSQSDEQHVIDTNVVLDQRVGGGLLIIDAQPPLNLSNATPYSPSSLSVIRDARRAHGRMVARTPYAWDLPVWLASGELAAIGLIHHHSLRDDVLNNEDDGRPRDRSFFPGASGNGRWSEAIYYHVLNCGFRIPPVAGSGSGTNGSPLGNNRVYVHCGEAFSAERWWEGLEAGRVFVTNGPLLRPIVEGKLPGHVFPLQLNETLSLQVGLELATRVPVEYLQIVKNGQVEAEARLADWKGMTGRLPPVTFDDSGWLLVRAVTNNSRNYQFASSGPYYVELAGRPRVSRRSVQFFLDWIDAAKARIGGFTDISGADRAALLAEQDSAREFFTGLLARANAE